jgi:hypothetical protein
MRDHCPTCGHHFERSDGFWLGSIMLNNAITFLAVLGTLAAFLIAGWPDPPWTAMLVSVLAVALVVPIVFHPITRSLWVAIELAVHPLDGSEVERAAASL